MVVTRGNRRSSNKTPCTSRGTSKAAKVLTHRWHKSSRPLSSPARSAASSPAYTRSAERGRRSTPIISTDRRSWLWSESSTAPRMVTYLRTQTSISKQLISRPWNSTHTARPNTPEIGSTPSNPSSRPSPKHSLFLLFWREPRLTSPDVAIHSMIFKTLTSNETASPLHRCSSIPESYVTR